MLSYSLAQWVLLFFVYAFLGWCMEVCFAGVTCGKFINRGFLNGPICPIYGFGMVIVILCLTPLEGNLLFLFLGALVLATLLEYITGFVLEKLFHAKWWDYSDYPFNLHGYICLKFSLLWGLAGTFIMRLIHPLVYQLIGLLPGLAGKLLAAVLCALFLADLIATVASIRHLQSRLAHIAALAEEMHTVSDAIGESLYENVKNAQSRSVELKEQAEDRAEALREQVQELRDRTEERLETQREALRDRQQALEKALAEALAERHHVHGRLLKAFPGLTSAVHQEALEQLRDTLEHPEKLKELLERRIKPRE